MPWSVRAVPLPDGDRPADLWIDATGCVSAAPVPDAEPLPGRYVAPGLVDAHAHPCVGPGPVARNHAETLDDRLIVVPPFKVTANDSSVRLLREGLMDLVAAKLRVFTACVAAPPFVVHRMAPRGLLPLRDAGDAFHIGHD